ncbi:MAG: hypothetical protein A2X23_11380 [Chloroflexi bacterium GWC2_73_18]|nr:MAG: hypothetical protein A2X23_11380 [Chloroflexi bacterium GWC2_73_18]
METASYYLFAAGALALGAAFALHVFATTLAARARRAAGAIATIRTAPAFATASVALGGGRSARAPFGARPAEPAPAAASVAIGAAWFAAVGLGLSMLLRAILVGRGPWGSMYEFAIAFAFGITAGYLALEGRYAIRSIGFLPLGVAAFLAGYALTLPHAIAPLVPALANPPLLTVHVAMAVISYGIFATSFGAAVGYLLQGSADRFAWLPSHKVLDEAAYRAVIVGFPVFATMIVLGSWWASIAWGRYWGWDPKETSALVTWLIYAVYLHARSQRGWAGRPAALILVVGFAAVLFTFFGNLFFSGLHAYSGL